ncbi:MAG: NrfD/PsrC family molybdoenzyme membrane anchor subunit [Candidatus Korobacteraceae bacterium]
MSTDPLQHPEQTDWLRENRLLEIRREAEKKGRVEAPGIRPAGAPFPIASPETGYYGVPLLKEPAWTWQIPIYFFAGGAAGSAAVVGLVARWIAHDRKLARDCRFIAAAGTAASSALLISDLGRPARFLAMMRVFKPQSPMSLGAWTLAVFGTFSAAAAFAELLKERFPFLPISLAGDVAEGISALAGLPFSNYTGVLIGASVIPVWNENVASLPIHFGMSGLNSAVSILELMGHQNRALNTLGMGASAIEVIEGHHIETTRKPAMGPLKHGRSGLITRLGGVLSGPVPLVLRVAAAFAGRRRARKLRKAAAISSLMGSMLTRVAWVHAGHVSARDWRLPLDVPRRLTDGQTPSS